MKSANFPCLRVDDELRAAAESVLREGETLSGFMRDAVRLNIIRRRAQCEFIARGMAAREDARRSRLYVSSGEMLKRLDESLAKTRPWRGGGARSE